PGARRPAPAALIGRAAGSRRGHARLQRPISGARREPRRRALEAGWGAAPSALPATAAPATEAPPTGSESAAGHPSGPAAARAGAARPGDEQHHDPTEEQRRGHGFAGGVRDPL